VEGVLEHWNLRCLVNLMGKVLWPDPRTAAFGSRWGLVKKTSLAVWALRVIMPKKPDHVHVRSLSHHGSCQHNHSYQRRHQTPLVREDLSSFLLDIREPVTSEERPLSLPAQACRISVGCSALTGSTGVSLWSREPDCILRMPVTTS
jgi:hypothetical protein